MSTFVGSSSYGEITKSGVKEMVKGIQGHFLNLSTSEERRHFRVLDIGGGLSTTMLHFAQKMNGYFAGIEVDPIRTIIFLRNYEQLLEENQGLIRNFKYHYLHKYLNDLAICDFDLVYSFDEVFIQKDWEKVMETFLASPGCKFWITFKLFKNKQWSKDLVSLLQEKT
jgi:hypothetical protein